MSPRTEQELLDATIDLATCCGWLVHHDRPARTARGWRTAIQGHAGFPDLVLARAGVVLFRELKGPNGRLTPEQQAWARKLNPDWPLALPGAMSRGLDHGGTLRSALLFDVWRPSDWDAVIVPTLTARATMVAS